MVHSGERIAVEWDRPSGRHLVAGIVALILSLVVHALMWLRPPALPMGLPLQLPVGRSYPPVRLKDLVADWFTLKRPSIFRAEDPTRREPQAADEWLQKLGEVVPPEPNLAAQELVGEQAPVATPPPLPRRAGWEPRQEILQVTDKLYGEEVSLLPRRYIPVVPRVPQAPDIVPPALAEWIASGREESPDIPSISIAAQEVVKPPEITLTEPAASTTPDAEQLAEQLSVLDETPSEIREVQPVESMLSFKVRTWAAPGEPYQYFELLIQRAGPELLPVLPKDVLLIQDCSESMTQARLNLCKAGLRRSLRMLRSQDRFDILTFRDTTERLFGRWVAPTPLNISIAEAYIERLVARGKTDVFGSLQQVARLDREPGRPVLGILVTDGRPTMGLVSSSDIIERFAQANAGAVSMFCVGGGRRVNRLLLDMLSYKNRGDSLVIEDDRRLPEAIAELSGEIQRPVLTDLAYHFSGVRAEDVYPKTLTHLYLDRPLALYGRCAQGTPRVVFQIAGRFGNRVADLVFEWDWNRVAPGDPGIRTRWAWQRIYYLIGEHVRRQSPEILAEIHALARQHGLVVPYGVDIPTR